MKKIMILMFAVIMMISTVFVLSACGHKHEWDEWLLKKDATCTINGEKERFCLSCGEKETQIIAAAHTYVDGKCSVCNELQPSSGLEFRLNGAGTEYSVYAGNELTDTHVVIPSTYNGKSVTSIDDFGFASEKIKTITIPDSVKSIGESAFSQCPNLESVIIPNGVTEILERTFFNCPNLASVTIPNSVTSIGKQAFWFCTKLDNVMIPNSVTSIGEKAFYSCESLSSITIPDGIIYIEAETFKDCRNLKSVILPDSVKEIKHSAFFECVRLEELYLGKGLTDIHSVAFGICNKLSLVLYSGSSSDWANVVNQGLNNVTVRFNVKQP